MGKDKSVVIWNNRRWLLYRTEKKDCQRRDHVKNGSTREHDQFQEEKTSTAGGIQASEVIVKLPCIRISWRASLNAVTGWKSKKKKEGIYVDI